LNSKVIYPSNLQKQNVKFALKVFNEKTIGALKCVASNNKDIFFKYQETVDFKIVFSTFWKIVNVHSRLEGDRFNERYRDPITPFNLMAIEFIEKMKQWLRNWRVSIPINKGLSAQTFQSLIITLE